EVEIKFNRKDPISILLVGVDERNGDSGRTDSMIVMTLNPTLKTSKLISIPRDTRADLIKSDGKLHSHDKMNHSYAFGGIEMTINSIENFLNIPIDYYVGVNMEGFKDIVDAVGGIDVNNQYAFELDGVTLAKGDQHLDGTEALMYARMRKEDPRGDFGRQERQREVISKVIDKGTSLKALTKYNNILKALEKNIKTSLTMDDMLGIQKNYKPAVEFMEKIEIEGTGGLIFNGKQDIWYYTVTDETRQELSDQLREHLGLPKTKIKPSSKQSKIEKQTNTESETQGYGETNITPKNNSQKTPQNNSGSNGQNNNGGISTPPVKDSTGQPDDTTTPPSGGTGTPPTQPDNGTGTPSGGGTDNGGSTGDQTGGGTNNPPGNEATPPPTSGTEGQTNG
ncbi:MAG: LCP family protein, partial [Bacillus sp. (in: firmicutes)]